MSLSFATKGVNSLCIQRNQTRSRGIAWRPRTASFHDHIDRGAREPNLAGDLSLRHPRADKAKQDRSQIFGRCFWCVHAEMLDLSDI